MKRRRDQPRGALLTLPAAAREFGIGRRQLKRAIEAGDVAVYQIGAWKRICRESVRRWIEKQRVPVTNHARARVEEVLAREERVAK